MELFYEWVNSSRCRECAAEFTAACAVDCADELFNALSKGWIKDENQSLSNPSSENTSLNFPIFMLATAIVLVVVIRGFTRWTFKYKLRYMFRVSCTFKYNDTNSELSKRRICKWIYTQKCKILTSINFHCLYIIKVSREKMETWNTYLTCPNPHY